MSHLYPRLDNLEAEAWLLDHRDDALSQLAEHAEVPWVNVTYAPTGGTVVPASEIERICELIREAARSFGYPSELRRSEGPRFDTVLAVTLHGSMHVSAAEASAGEVWTCLAVCGVPDVVAWRFGFGNRERWVASDLSRHALGRLWWQAYTVGTREPDGNWSYDLLGVLAESELNQVFERPSLGGIPPLARTIIRAIEAMDLPEEVARRAVIRDAIKRLRRIWPYTSFLAMSHEVLEARVRALFADSVNAMSLGDARSPVE